MIAIPRRPLPTKKMPIFQPTDTYAYASVTPVTRPTAKMNAWSGVIPRSAPRRVGGIEEHSREDDEHAHREVTAAELRVEDEEVVETVHDDDQQRRPGEGLRVLLAIGDEVVERGADDAREGHVEEVRGQET